MGPYIGSQLMTAFAARARYYSTTCQECHARIHNGTIYWTVSWAYQALRHALTQDICQDCAAKLAPILSTQNAVISISNLKVIRMAEYRIHYKQAPKPTAEESKLENLDHMPITNPRDVPPNHTCQDCYHYHHCETIFGTQSIDNSCQFNPPRFHKRSTPAKPEKPVENPVDN